MTTSSSSSLPTTTTTEPFKFRTQIFDHLKNAGEVFENRIARPLLAFSREFRRPPSTDRSRNSTSKKSIDNNVEIKQSVDNTPPILIETNNNDNLMTPNHHTIDEIKEDNIVDNNIPVTTMDSMKTAAGNIFNSIIHTLSPKANRRQSDTIQEFRKTNCRSSSICTTTRNERLNQYQRKSKCVSFAEDIDMDNEYEENDQEKIIKNACSVADKILTSSLNVITYMSPNICENNTHQQSTLLPSSSSSSLSSISTVNDNDFNISLHRSFRRPLSSANEELCFQDLSAEIVNYVLKHAIKVLKQEQLNMKNISNDVDNNLQSIDLNIKSTEDDEDDIIDLK
ncbi:unnamed protein product [Didymodactylos carnosus]|uniref:Uncharacterized protein n=1 Tax=Didymodactylos carnosus TaxID=1234261 RepID=A0A815MXS9_9BILA|nr:unnamed protein product [Didymodactylos carnosus]CAF4306939.1 unnamed protein product [Didymodactylos carnosus]